MNLPPPSVLPNPVLPPGCPPPGFFELPALASLPALVKLSNHPPAVEIGAAQVHPLFHPSCRVVTEVAITKRMVRLCQAGRQEEGLALAQAMVKALVYPRQPKFVGAALVSVPLSVEPPEPDCNCPECQQKRSGVKPKLS